MEPIGPFIRKYLDRVLKSATGADVKVEAGDKTISITETLENVTKAKTIMDKVQGLRLDTFQEDGNGNATAVYVKV